MSCLSTTWRFFVTLYIMTAMLLSVLLSFLTQLFCFVFIAPFMACSCCKRARLQMMGNGMRFPVALLAVWLNPFWRVTVLRPLPQWFRPRKTIVMANHLSGSDPFVLASSLYPWDFKYVYKGDLHKLPIAGWCPWLAGDLAVHFTKDKGGWGTEKSAIAEMMQKAKELVNMGVGIAMFPEGTRSRFGRLQPFKPGFFKFAIENECEILPVVMEGTQRAWPMAEKLMNCANIYVMYGDPIPAQGKTVDQLRDEVREAMIQLLRLSPAHDPESEQPLTDFATERGATVM
eukprot:GDKI01040321.1.p1 GENE.GDKI01040321.1~~GDKI01040321.1.p1  ORF type:complete len:287 (+),score=34.83 GDKI01040321.1:95-955(+)